MAVLKGLQPHKVFEYFEEISAIPRGSYHEKEISEYVMKVARKAGLKCKRDDLWNVIITKPATPGYEDEEPVILQGHMDMVCERVAGSTHNFERDPLSLLVKDDFIMADGTTLGADDGIAVAYILAIMTSKKLEHPKLYGVLTVAEEVGMDGAIGIEMSKVRAKRLINIDSEEEGKILVGCAGGNTSIVTLPIERIKEKGMLCKISLSGLTGGHSGTEIHLGRANANKLLGRILNYLRADGVSFFIKEFSGGTRHNVIPTQASMTLIVKKKSIELLEESIDRIITRFKAEFAETDPGLDVYLYLDKKQKITEHVLDEASMKAAMTLLNMTKNGVLSYSSDIEGLVETSSNLAIISTAKKEMRFEFSIRSSEAHAKQSAVYSIRNICEVLNAEMTVESDYPAWEIVKDSPLQKKAVAVYERLYGKKPELTAVHAGLECGILAPKIDGLDAISIGPDTHDIHTPSERLSISSAGRVYEYIIELLQTKDEASEREE